MNTNEIHSFDLNENTAASLGFSKALTNQLIDTCNNYPRISWKAELAIKEMMLAGSTKVAIAREVREIIA